MYLSMEACLLTESKTLLRNTLLMHVTLDMEQKTLHPFPKPQEGPRDFQSVFITVFIQHSSEAELELIVTAS